MEAPERRRKRVLVLGGWSPGPLEVLQSRFASDVDFEEPSIPMPPAGLRWCLNPFWVLLLLVVFGLLPAWLSAPPALAQEDGTWAWIINCVVLLVVTPFLLRFLVAGLVWFSIQDGVGTATRAIRQFEPDVVLAFSWGGGLACWLLAKQGWAGPTILLAPTVKAMARICCCSPPKLPRPTALGPVHVFQPEDDPFCPASQVEVLRAAGCEVHLLRDSHVLLKHGSVSEIATCLEQLLSLSVAPVQAKTGFAYAAVGSDD
ncbi:unnamed protein product [Polarella glacialis]|uniref:Uncharacterized protein n=1 Tax=Polarella glacialis TaxID=89957 RepID=A0A813KJK5_POLGL|nr:unnamed protein product [Polarella glacialis]